MEIEVSVSSDVWLKGPADVEALVQQAATAALAGHDVGLMKRAGEVAVTLADDEALQVLNREHRGFDKPTNVLSFPMWDGDDFALQDTDIFLGDVIIAHGVANREARAGGKELSAHLSHLVVHGVLHLLGYDHEDDDDAEIMETLEIEILERLNISNPYH